MSHPTLRDEDVARLPLDQAHAELREAIMQTPVERSAADRRTPRRWPVVAASAAVVAALVAVPAFTLDGSSDRNGPATGPTTATPTPQATPDTATTVECAKCSTTGATTVPGGRFVVLDLATWSITALEGDDDYVDSTYQRGDRSLQITGYPSTLHTGFEDSRGDVSAPTPQHVLGLPGKIYTYGPRDHSTIRQAQAGWFIELRGRGMPLAAYQRLLTHLVQTDADGFAAVLPDGFVTPANTGPTTLALLDGVDSPPGFTIPSLEGFMDRYQASATVTGAVGCAWLDRVGHGASREEVAAVFDGSRKWPVLRAIADRGGYSEQFWGIAEKLRRGQAVSGLKQSICAT